MRSAIGNVANVTEDPCGRGNDTTSEAKDLADLVGAGGCDQLILEIMSRTCAAPEVMLRL